MRVGVTLQGAQSALPSAASTRAEAFVAVRARLERAGIDGAERDAEWILVHALDISRTEFWCDPHETLRPQEAAGLEALVLRRERREPLQQILGDVPFHGVILALEPGVFIPRPETEILVETVLARLRSASMDEFPGALLDWGTGTGAIAVALARALPRWNAIAADRSHPARSLAERNAVSNGVASRLRVLEADFTAPDRAAPLRALASLTSTTPRTAPFDLLVSNPPYVRRAAIADLMPEVRDPDPREALDGGFDGLDAHRHLALGLPSWLRPGGLLAVEIGADQADDVLGIFGPHIQDARLLSDWAGLPRIVIGTMRGGGTQ